MVNISMDSALSRLDLRVPGSHKIRCPAHDERVPSLHIYDDHFYCFSCNRNGDGAGLIALFTGRSVIDILKAEGGDKPFVRTSASSHLTSERNLTLELLEKYHDLTRTFWNNLRESWCGYTPFWQYDRTVCYWDEHFDDLLTTVKDRDLPGWTRWEAIEDLRLKLDYELV